MPQGVRTTGYLSEICIHIYDSGRALEGDFRDRLESLVSESREIHAGRDAVRPPRVEH